MSTSSASDAATRGGTEKGLARVAQSLAAWTEKWFPDAYIFALVGVVVISLAAMLNGASPVAIVDAFEAVMLKHIHRGRNRSVLRAIAEINACDNQFAPEWIEPFNQVIHKTLEA